LKEVRSGRESYTTIDFIEVEEIEDLLRENLNVIFNTTQQII